MFRTLTLLLTLLVGVLASSPSPAQEASDVFGDVIDVRVINLEVVVTEKGVRVSGLGPDDFLLTVDGREVPIEYFTEVLGGSAVETRSVETAGTVPALAPGEEVGTSYLIFIDEFFSLPTHRDRVLRRFIEQLPNLGLDDRMAVVAFDGRQVEMLSTWSQSVEALTRVFENALQRPAFGLQRRAERRLFEDEFVRNDRFGTLGLTANQRQQSDRIARQTERVALAASSVLRSFANPPGRKVMLLLSGGWPFNTYQWVNNGPTLETFGSGARAGTRRFSQLVETANRLSYTLYPVDVPGVSAGSGISAEDSSITAAQRRSSLAFNREEEEEATLLSLARETGGKALLDGANLYAFERVVEDTRSYYWIGFTPDWQGDDTSHRVKIRPRGKGLKLRSRRSFSDLSRSTEVSMMVESALLFGDLPSAAPLEVKVGPGKRSGWGKSIVPITIQIPLDELTFLPQGPVWLADAELRVAVLDEAGNTSEIPVIPLGMRVPRQPQAKEVSTYETQLKMRRRKHELVVSIYDRPSGQILSARVPVDPR